jgi:hypothetical protein
MNSALARKHRGAALRLLPAPRGRLSATSRWPPGRFDAYHFEINCRRFAGPEAAQPELLIRIGRWYAPTANHWAKEAIEAPSGDGRLIQKYTAALIDYKLR